MPAIVLVGHRHSCPLHGMGTITLDDSGITIEGIAIWNTVTVNEDSAS